MISQTTNKFPFDGVKSKKEWAEIGLLEGLSDKQQDILVEFFNKLDYEKLEAYSEHYEIEGYILPVIRRIVTGIICDEPDVVVDPSLKLNKNITRQYSHISRSVHGVNENELLALVDVEEITWLLCVYSEGFIPFAKIFLSSLDAEAESVALFCNNYVLKLIDRVKSIDRKLLEDIKKM